MYYHILLGTKHIDLIKASSSEEAIKLIELKFGSARIYSNEYEYRAVRA
jgi:hypothetical protein